MDIHLAWQIVPPVQSSAASFSHRGTAGPHALRLQSCSRLKSLNNLLQIMLINKQRSTELSHFVNPAG
jgi:hypothetical protein